MKTYLKLASLLLALMIALPAAAMTLNEAMSALGDAKASGLLGEKPDGYLGVVRSSQNAEDIASQINQARRAEYHRVAKQNGISVSDVEAIAGKKAIERSEEHTSELQSLMRISYAVFCLKKKNRDTNMKPQPKVKQTLHKQK